MSNHLATRTGQNLNDLKTFHYYWGHRHVKSSVEEYEASLEALVEKIRRFVHGRP